MREDAAFLSSRNGRNEVFSVQGKKSKQRRQISLTLANFLFVPISLLADEKITSANAVILS